MNICVVGAGAIGGWIAAKLALAGEPSASGARPARAAELDGFELEEMARSVAAAELADDSHGRRAGLLIIAVKAPALPACASELRPLIGPETIDRADAQRRALVVRRGRAAALGRSGRKHRGGPAVRPDCRLRRPRLVQPLGAQSHRRVNHADKLIIGEPRRRERASASARLFALFDGAGPQARPDRQCPARDLVQIVGQCDDQPAVGADPRDLRQDPRRSRMPGVDARGHGRARGDRRGDRLPDQRERRRPDGRSPRGSARSRPRCFRMSRPAGRSSSRLCSARRARSRARCGIDNAALDRLYGVTQADGREPWA